MPHSKVSRRCRLLNGLALLFVGPLISWLAFGLLVRFQELPASLDRLPFTWAYYLGITALPMLFGLILTAFVRPAYGWLVYALGSAFMLYGQAKLLALPPVD
ncbi:hypothetical protein D7T60_16015 [Stenotrophomonas maltophilia]|uniref:hypothetical protein n=1 Tax=Stenotrophomonas maltophilia TaxID=40324 RepID=UPI0015DF22B6|nr:hypothetical protein [Stenotrophomonas maltophilia]MBA0376449.1 hypothetical protein [Stenotrophomonas maltophilia]MBA0546340.1 hypothetical protein [Stenotrophomonas maltophilia]